MSTGDVESTEPTKSLMRIAEYIDGCPESIELREWLGSNQQEVLDMLAEEEQKAAAVGKRTVTKEASLPRL